MKILHVVLSMECGGLERVVAALAREAQRRGHRVDVLCLQREGVVGAELRAAGIEPICLHKPAGVRLGLIPKISRVLRLIRPDVIHTHQVGALFYVGPASRVAGIEAIVHTEHLKHYRDPPFRKRWLGRIAGTFAQRVIGVSNDIASELEAQRIVPRRKLHVVANGIPTTRHVDVNDAMQLREALGIPARALVVGSIGRLSEIKRQDILIRAFAGIRESVPDAHLLLVGDGPMMPALKALAAEAGLNGQLHFAGYQPRPERYLRAMDVFAQSSRDEGMPLAVLEAWAAGLPVIATRVGGLPEMIDRDCGILFEPNDEAALSDAMLALLTDRARAQRLGEAGRRRVVEHYDVTRMADEYHNHYAQMLARSEQIA